MLLSDIDYIGFHNNGSIIYFSDGNKIYSQLIPKKVVNLFKINTTKITSYKNPIYIKNIIFQPTKALKLFDCEFINLINVIKIKQSHCGTYIYYRNNIIHSELPSNIIYRYLKTNVLCKIRINMLLD